MWVTFEKAMDTSASLQAVWCSLPTYRLMRRVMTVRRRPDTSEKLKSFPIVRFQGEYQ